MPLYRYAEQRAAGDLTAAFLCSGIERAAMGARRHTLLE
jgi:hypothetical protein